ncbi:MAG: transposase family protein [Propionivibrio sp.]|nr:transposase family protein [Propionivibrio sp.]
MGDKKGIEGLIERFTDLPDARVEGRTDHDLLDIVVLALCAVMSGAEGWDDMEDWGVSGKRGCGATCRCATAFPATTPSGGYSRRSRRWNWSCALKPGWVKSVRR